MADAMERESEKKGGTMRVLSKEDSIRVRTLAEKARKEVITEYVRRLTDREWSIGERMHTQRPHLKALFGQEKAYKDSRIIPYLKPFKGCTPKQYFKKQLKVEIEERKKEKRKKGRADIVGPHEAKKIEDRMIEETADQMLRIIMLVGARVLEVSRQGYNTIKNMADSEKRVDAKKFVYSDYERKERWKMAPGPAEEEMMVKQKGKWMSLHIFMTQIAAKYKEIEKDLSEWRGYWNFLKDKKKFPSWRAWSSKERTISRFNKLPMDYELNRVITPLEMEILKNADEIMSKNYWERAKRNYGKKEIEEEVKKVFELKLAATKIKPTQEAKKRILKQTEPLMDYKE